MTPTLQDVAYLLGLPIIGEAVGPRVVAAWWKDDLEARFALVDRVEEAGSINPHPRAAGPSKIWFLQFTVCIHCILKFNCYNSHVALSVQTINLNCLCSLPYWLRMRACGLLQPSWFTTSRLRDIAPEESGDSLGSRKHLGP